MAQEVTDVIAKARKSTVSIVTPKGSGSGFFINPNYIITNKHVIKSDQEEMDRLKNEVDSRQKLLDLEKKKLADWKKKLKSNIDENSKKQIKILIGKMKGEIKDFEDKLNELAARYEAMRKPVAQSEIKVIMEDGSEHACQYLKLSSNNDLAILSVDVYDSPFLLRGEDRSLKQGQKVYTLGSPVGLRNTVTSGVFSGYRVREDNGRKYLQTDAPINPGNSGGPLIDEQGRVHGINTMILRNTEGIGFAIPISAAFDEFSELTAE
ncbi:MAG: hypothetical protein CSB24_04745 [Deltaproteobacteria bacterium]|nr:MAG: hypothetical protein CSB24_04745 [Deltaproteobacteria bacterium]